MYANPFQEFNHFRRQVDRMFRDFDRTMGYDTPFPLLGTGGVWDDPFFQQPEQQRLMGGQGQTQGQDSKLNKDADGVVKSDPTLNGKEEGGRQVDVSKSGDQQLSTQPLGGSLWQPGSMFSQSMQMPQCKLDIVEEKNKYIVNAEVPGLKREEIDIQIDNGMLVLKGEHKNELKHEDKDRKYLRMERHYGSFQRAVRLPADVDSTGVKAQYENGILKIDLPRLPQDKVKKGGKIQIQ